LGVAIGIF